MPGRVAYDPQPRAAPNRQDPVQVHLRMPPVDGVVRWHQHRWGQIACPRIGNIRVSAAGTMWIVPTFRAVWIPPSIEHELVMLGRVEFYIAYIEPKHAPRSLEHCSVIAVTRLMQDLMESLAGQKEPPSFRRRLRGRLLLEEMRQAETLPLGLPLPTDRRLATLCDALMNDPGSGATLAGWARRIGASERTLARLFTDELGTSFGAWRRQLRLVRAIDLLGRGTSITAVSAELGYANATAFTSMFKRALGFPPSRLETATHTASHIGAV
jgi:AraC-like DNA-binding protein